MVWGFTFRRPTGYLVSRFLFILVTMLLWGGALFEKVYPCLYLVPLFLFPLFIFFPGNEKCRIQYICSNIRLKSVLNQCFFTTSSRIHDFHHLLIASGELPVLSFFRLLQEWQVGPIVKMRLKFPNDGPEVWFLCTQRLFLLSTMWSITVKIYCDFVL